MFALIDSIRHEVHKTSFNLPLTDVKSRHAVVTAVVQQLYNTAVPENQTTISVYSSPTHQFFDFRSSSFSARLFVPTLLFIKSEEIKQFTRNEDHYLNDKNSLKEYYNTIPLTLALMQDKRKAQAAIKFALMHELGHIHYSDAHHKRDWYWISGSLSISCPIAAALLIKGPLLPSIFWIVVATSISFFALKLIFDIPISRFIENRADAFACKYCPDSIEGGIHFLQIRMQRNQRIRQEILKKIDRQEAEHSNTSTLSAIIIKCASAIRRCRLKARISAEGDLLSFGHPSDSTRITNLKRFQELAPSL